MNRKYFDTIPNTPRTTPFDIFVDQAGYCPKCMKRAIIPFECDSFEITDIKGNVRYSGNTTPSGYDKESGDNIWLADFSGFAESGSYCFKADDKISAMFRIGDDVYLCKINKN